MNQIIESFSLYYGLDWLAFGAGLWGMYLITNKNRLGFAMSIIACLSGFAVALISSQFGFVIYNAVLITMMVRGFLNWGRETQADDAAKALPEMDELEQALAAEIEPKQKPEHLDDEEIIPARLMEDDAMPHIQRSFSLH